MPVGQKVLQGQAQGLNRKGRQVSLEMRQIIHQSQELEQADQKVLQALEQALIQKGHQQWERALNRKDHQEQELLVLNYYEFHITFAQQVEKWGRSLPGAPNKPPAGAGAAPKAGAGVGAAPNAGAGVLPNKPPVAGAGAPNAGAGVGWPKAGAAQDVEDH